MFSTKHTWRGRFSDGTWAYFHWDGTDFAAARLRASGIRPLSRLEAIIFLLKIGFRRLRKLPKKVFVSWIVNHTKHKFLDIKDMYKEPNK